MARGKRNIRTNAPKAADAETGAMAVRKFMIGLFDREDGRAANWPLIAETLFRSAFEALEEIPDEAQPDALLKGVHDRVYNRLVGNEAGPGTGPAEVAPGAAADSGLSVRRDFRP